jgi:carbonic anhydrase
MEMHLVHQSTSGALLVVSVMLIEGTGDNPFIQHVWNDFPDEKEVEMPGTSQIDFTGLFFSGIRYYNYIGSLTTPPCSMGLQWIILTEPVILSTEQIDFFKARYNHNYRPVQPLNNRLVYQKI